MAKCPWLKDVVCTRCGRITGDISRWDKRICRGAQVEGTTYKDCRYYENPKDFASGNSYRPCPCSIVKETPKAYITYCKSKKNPRTSDGENAVLISGERAAYCLGRTYQGKKYTSCPYYVKGGNRKTSATTKKNNYNRNSKKLSKRGKSSGQDDQYIKAGINYIKILVIIFIVVWLLKNFPF